MNDVEAAPTRTEHIDPFGAWIPQKGLPRVRINFLGCKPPHILEGHRNSFHGHHLEAGFAEVTCRDVVDAVDEIRHADELLNVQRAQGLDLSLSRSDHGSFVPGFPFLNNLVFTLIPVNHKWRSEERRVGKECRSRWSRAQQKTGGRKLTSVTIRRSGS